ncbi:MAG: circadian clock protein KaiB [Candidatus Riflebacteria bacterium HGW-Riflebacteria-1]|jgi:circadian clock protein KaiB|nr:MAG: circadian clock protein KaiB [Candidatus Riflebacteria bacterium HGW-Riflebacteria-1]
MNQPVGEKWILKLYIAGMTPTARRALANLQAICEEHMAGSYSLEIIDLVESPALEDGEQIFAVPTLVRHLPPPLRKIIGDFSDTEKVLVGLDVKPISRS